LRLRATSTPACRLFTVKKRKGRRLVPGRARDGVRSRKEVKGDGTLIDGTKYGRIGMSSAATAGCPARVATLLARTRRTASIAATKGDERDAERRVPRTPKKACRHFCFLTFRAEPLQLADRETFWSTMPDENGSTDPEQEPVDDVLHGAGGEAE